MGAQNTQKGNSPTGLRTRSCPASYKRCFFRRSRLFIRATSDKPAIGESEERSKPAIGDGDFRRHGANYCTYAVRLQYSGRLWVRTHHTPKHFPTYGRALCVGVFLNERAVPPYTVGKEMPQSWR